MIEVIVYDEISEISNLKEFLKEDVKISAYLKDSKEFYGNSINGIKIYVLDEIRDVLNSNEFDYLIINSRCSNRVYEKIKEFKIDPKYILDVSFFSYDFVNENCKQRFLYCNKEEYLDFNIMFLGRNYIKDEFISEYFDNYINLSNVFSDIHYDYHLIYDFIKNNKIDEKMKLGIFMNYSMLYENIDFSEDKLEFIKNFEEVFFVHNNINLKNNYFNLCKDNFKQNSLEVFKEFYVNSLIYSDNMSILNFGIDKLKYDVQLETLSYKSVNNIIFKMNKNILSQKINLISKNNIDMFFIIPPVHREYRIYINKILKKEFYMILNKNMNQNLYIFDYFELDLEDKYFSSPSRLNHDGCREFLKVLSFDLKNKFQKEFFIN